MNQQLPAELGFTLPAEWETHSGTWVSYPHNPDSFYDRVDAARDIFTKMVGYIASGETVHVNVNDNAMAQDFQKRLKKHNVQGSVEIHLFSTDDAWCRDNGSIFLKNRKTNEIAAVNSRFNAWGGKYSFERDAKIANQMTQHLQLPVFNLNRVFEGGSIESNGAGIALTTKDCLLNQNRNPDLSQKKIEETLRNYFGIQKVLWLNQGIAGDDTDSHIDQIARFVSEKTIVAAMEENPNDENYKILNENLELLHSFTDLEGNPFEIVMLPMPEPVHFHIGKLPASYANFYIGNQTVIVPTFNCPQDKTAINILKKHFPEREVVGLDARDIVLGQGAFHCLTTPIPK